MIESSYKKESIIIERMVDDNILGNLKKYRAIIAGGAITSIFNKREISQ